MKLSTLAAAVALGIVLLGQIVSGQNIPANSTRIDTITVELTPFGFSPAQVSHAHGHFFLYVRNNSGPAPRSLSLSMVTPGGHVVVKNKSLNQTSPHWIAPLDLGAAKYEITERDHSSWTCTINVQ